MSSETHILNTLNTFNNIKILGWTVKVIYLSESPETTAVHVFLKIRSIQKNYRLTRLEKLSSTFEVQCSVPAGWSLLHNAEFSSLSLEITFSPGKRNFPYPGSVVALKHVLFFSHVRS